MELPTDASDIQTSPGSSNLETLGVKARNWGCPHKPPPVEMQEWSVTSGGLFTVIAFDAGPWT